MIRVDGQAYGTAAQIARELGRDVTPAMVRNWYRRDGLAGHRIGRTVYHPLHQAAQIERDKRLAGRGRPRQLDMACALD